MQNILLLCSLPSCMTKYYKKYLEDYKVPIKDNINLAKIDVFYQLSRILLYKTKGKVIVLFPLHDKVYRENDSLLRKIRKEIEKIFFSNVNPQDEAVNLEERRRNFFCFLMDEEGLFEEISSSVNSKYPTHIIIFNMFLQNKNTGEFFNHIMKSKIRHKIILYQLYINNLIEGKLSQVFYSKLNQFIEICTSPLRKMKTTVYGQLTLAEKEIITISGLKKTYETELSNTNINNSYNKNDLSKINIITSYKDLHENEKYFDGFIYIKKNSYLMCTNSNDINLRFDQIYNSFIGNVSYNNYDNTLINNNINNNANANNNHNPNNVILEDNLIGSANNTIQVYNSILTEYRKKKFYQELDFLKDESNFDKLKINKYDLTGNKNDNNNNINNAGNNATTNGNNNNNQNNVENENINNNNNNINNNQNNINDLNNSPNTRGEEIYVLSDSTDNINGLRGVDGPNGQQKRRRGRKKKNQLNNNGINLGSTNNNIIRDNNNNNNANNNEPIQIANDEDNEEMNSFLSDDMRSITNNIINDTSNNLNNNNNNNNINNNNNAININNNNENNNNNNASNVNSNNNDINNNNNENNINLNQINEESIGDNLNNINNNNDINSNHNIDSVPVNLDEITEDYSDTITENMEQDQNINPINNKEENQQNNENNPNNDNNNNKMNTNSNEQQEQQPMDVEDNNNNNELNKDKDKEQSKEDNNERTLDLIKNIANSIIQKNQIMNNNTNNINNANTNNINDSNMSQADKGNNNNLYCPENEETKPIEKLINDTKFESSRDRLFIYYNYLLTKGFEEKTRKLFVRCLLNYGFPLNNEFDKFYILFQMNAKHLNIKNIPNKTDTKFYYELVYFILEEDESLDYNIFVFGEERTSLVRTKLLIIRQFQTFKDVSKTMLYYVKDMYNVLFAHIEPKLDESYQRVHFVMAKLLSNIVTKSIKSGFLNFRSYIQDDNIIFDNIRIKKDGQASVFNIREGISKKIFGKPLNEKEFNNVVELYYKALFSQVIKVPDNIINSGDNVR